MLVVQCQSSLLNTLKYNTFVYCFDSLTYIQHINPKSKGGGKTILIQQAHANRVVISEFQNLD